MARIKLLSLEETSGAERERYEVLANNNKVTNMKRGLLQDAATYDAVMGWYTSWNRLVEVISVREATIYAHAISTTNSCMLCSLFFISDLKELGIDPGSFVPTDREQLLIDLGQQIVKDPTAVSDELFAELKKVWKDNELVVIVGFAAQMIATNNFNSVFQIDIDSRLLPIKDEFKPATWRATQA